jgi:hypothetical protein
MTRAAEFAWRPDPSAWPSQAASLSLHLGILAMCALLVPPPVADAETGRENEEWIRHLLAAQGDGTDDDATPGDKAIGEDPASGKTGAPSSAGSSSGRAVEHRTAAAARGPMAVGASFRVEPGDAAAFVMIGLLADLAGGDTRAELSPWSRGVDTGPLARSAVGGDCHEIGCDRFGEGGLGLSGVGSGSGDPVEGIHLDGVGTIGHDHGVDLGQGFANGHGRVGGSHQARAPSITCGSPNPEVGHEEDSGCSTTVTGRLPPETVQRIVRQSFGRFRLCYEEGLRTNPGLEGRVVVKFVIDRAGGVSVAQDGGSDLREESVVSCVVRSFQALSFPQPEGGVVVVRYPLVLSPGGA